MTLIIPAEITAQAQADPKLLAAFNTEIQHENARFLSWQSEAKRSSGVCWGGTGPDPFISQRPEALLAAAREKVALQEKWEASHYGRFVRAEQRVEKMAAEIATEIEAIASARSRADHRIDPSVIARVQRVRAMVADIHADVALMELVGPAAMADAGQTLRAAS